MKKLQGRTNKVEILTDAKVFDFLPYPILISDLNERNERYHILVNKKFTEELGYTIEEIPTFEDWFSTVYPDREYAQSIKDEWTKLVSDAVNTGQDFVSKKTLLFTKNRGYIWYEVKASLFGPTQFVAFLNIDDEIRRKEELYQLFSVISHDVKSPLNSLIGLFSLHDKYQVPAERIVEHFPKIKTTLKLVNNLATNLLEWSSSQISEGGFKKTPISLFDLVDDTIIDETIISEGKNNKIISSIDTNYTVMCDKNMIHSVLRNLIANANKFTENGEISISAKAITGNMIEISVADTGVGMTPEQLGQLFIRGQRNSSMGTSGEKGSGLGLLFSKNFVEKHGGQMHVTSEFGKGTKFYFTLPRQI